jgi:hypothetical protein
VNLLGSYIPFARTRADRDARKDPRLSIQERYRDQDDYLAKLRAAAGELVKGRYLLPEGRGERRQARATAVGVRDRACHDRVALTPGHTVACMPTACA